MRDPSHLQGPFIEGGATRWFRRGRTDPTSPRLETGSARVERGAGSPTAGPSRERQHGVPRRVLGWIIRVFGLRIALAGVALLLVLIGSWHDHATPASTHLDIPTPALSTPPPGGNTPSAGATGSDLVTITGVFGARVAVTDLASRPYSWSVPSPALRRTLAGRRGDNVVVAWRRQGGDVVVVGVSDLGATG
ncbi:MAG: hypothetical protein JWM98_68 [Thermoleophilia bacterium]|nr:hypothetical protein [Thermoleophilia bacterium]